MRVSDAQLRRPSELDRPGRQEQARYPQARQGLPHLDGEPWRELREQLYTLGEYDIIMVAEFRDDETAAAAVLAAASVGNVRVKTVRAFTVGKLAEIIV